ncbi:phage tail protein [Comamonas sp. HJ-2]
MAHVFADLILESSQESAPIGAALQLNGALPGYRPFSAVCAHGDTVHYMVREVDQTGRPTGAWELGRGTYRRLNGFSTLGRDMVLGSSVANNGAVPFADGRKLVQLACVAPNNPAVQADWREALDIETRPGTIIETASNSVPKGYYKCDGSKRNRVSDVRLYVEIGTKYGAGDGATTFNLPTFSSTRQGCMVCIKY